MLFFTTFLYLPFVSFSLFLYCLIVERAQSPIPSRLLFAVKHVKSLSQLFPFWQNLHHAGWHNTFYFFYCYFAWKQYHYNSIFLVFFPKVISHSRRWKLNKKNKQKKIPLACDAPPVKSMHFCLKHMMYQNHGIVDLNVWVPSIYDDNQQYQLWSAICENFSKKHISIKLVFFRVIFDLWKILWFYCNQMTASKFWIQTIWLQ